MILGGAFEQEGSGGAGGTLQYVCAENIHPCSKGTNLTVVIIGFPRRNIRRQHVRELRNFNLEWVAPFFFAVKIPRVIPKI